LRFDTRAMLAKKKTNTASATINSDKCHRIEV